VITCKREVKNKIKFETFSSKSDRGRLRGCRLQEVPKYSNLTRKLWENWSSRRGGRLQEVVATGGSSVIIIGKL